MHLWMLNVSKHINIFICAPIQSCLHKNGSIVIAVQCENMLWFVRCNNHLFTQERSSIWSKKGKEYNSQKSKVEIKVGYFSFSSSILNKTPFGPEKYLSLLFWYLKWQYSSNGFTSVVHRTILSTDRHAHPTLERGHLTIKSAGCWCCFQ